MYDLILQVIIMLSLAAMIYLVARVVPRVSEMAAPANQKNYLDGLVRKIPFEKIDAFLNSLVAKILRKAKILVLKLDNLISHNLGKFKTTNSNGKEAFSRDMLNDSKEDKTE